MKTWIIFSLLLLSIYADSPNQAAATPPKPSNVTELTEVVFLELLKNEKYILVSFYTDYCQHCKDLVPIYEEAATVAKQQGSPFVFTRINAYGEATYKIRERYNVTSFPTLIAFIRGIPVVSNRDTTIPEILSFLQQKISAKVGDIKTVRDATLVKYGRGFRVRLLAVINLGHSHQR